MKAHRRITLPNGELNWFLQHAYCGFRQSNSEWNRDVGKPVTCKNCRRIIESRKRREK